MGEAALQLFLKLSDHINELLVSGSKYIIPSVFLPMKIPVGILTSSPELHNEAPMELDWRGMEDTSLTIENLMFCHSYRIGSHLLEKVQVCFAVKHSDVRHLTPCSLCLKSLRRLIFGLNYRESFQMDLRSQVKTELRDSSFEQGTKVDCLMEQETRVVSFPSYCVRI